MPAPLGPHSARKIQRSLVLSLPGRRRRGRRRLRLCDACSHPAGYRATKTTPWPRSPTSSASPALVGITLRNGACPCSAIDSGRQAPQRSRCPTSQTEAVRAADRSHPRARRWRTVNSHTAYSLASLSRFRPAGVCVPAELHSVRERSSHRLSVSVVQVATPVPRKSLSFVQTSADSARAPATTGQSVASRNERARASSSSAE